MDLLEDVPAFVLCLELGGSAYRDTDLLALAGNQLVLVLPIVEKLSLFKTI